MENMADTNKSEEKENTTNERKEEKKDNEEETEEYVKELENENNDKKQEEEKEEKTEEQAIKREETAIDRKEESEVNYSLDNFDILKVVGTGTFARVCLCQHKVTNASYALKILTMADVIKLKQVEHVKNEKQILSEVQHPFIVPLLWSHKDSHCLYMLFPFISGGELFSHLRRLRRFPPDTALFYSAEIVSALDYLHSQLIIYRDLKPENLLLDTQGHLVITDFGFAKKVEGRTWTLCGTPEYLAPEIIMSKVKYLIENTNSNMKM